MATFTSNIQVTDMSGARFVLYNTQERMEKPTNLKKVAYKVTYGKEFRR